MATAKVAFLAAFKRMLIYKTVYFRKRTNPAVVVNFVRYVFTRLMIPIY